MARGEDAVRWYAELLAPLGAVRTRAMFGGHGVYVDELFVAIVVGELLYLKTDVATDARFRAAGSEPFVYESRGRKTTMNFWRAPAQALESPAAMTPWGRLAMEAAARKASGG
ncbi:MAG: TfoX/Sxy family protein [Burkholderiales bacterium]|nr:TfoX/Sxy family protein [Burkholderiales bacterium]